MSASSIAIKEPHPVREPRAPGHSFRILVVDDDAQIRDMLTDKIAEAGYPVDASANAEEALESLASRPYHLVLSDIEMPGMTGFELIAEIRRLYPQTKIAMITAHDVNNYIQMALDYDIGNIIVKTVPFRTDEVIGSIRRLLHETFFGLEHYLEPGTTIETFELRNASEISRAAEFIASSLPHQTKKLDLRLAIVELLTNAVFHGILKAKRSERMQWESTSLLPEGKSVKIQFGADRKKSGVSVMDSGGVMRKKDILYWLSRQLTKGADGIPLGVNDEHGRGIMISRHCVDRMLVNIKQGEKAEVILLNYLKPQFKSHKPLLINEV